MANAGNMASATAQTRSFFMTMPDARFAGGGMNIVLTSSNAGGKAPARLARHVTP
jgi:hypothetical protein